MRRADLPPDDDDSHQPSSVTILLVDLFTLGTPFALHSPWMNEIDTAKKKADVESSCSTERRWRLERNDQEKEDCAQ
jgi:hypothetical protein